MGHCFNLEYFFQLFNLLKSLLVCRMSLQSALTGESLPVTKGPGDGVYSGSTCKQGEIEAIVIATGVHTFFGKAAHLVDTTNQVGHFQKVTNFLLEPSPLVFKMFFFLILMFAGFDLDRELLYMLNCCWNDH